MLSPAQVSHRLKIASKIPFMDDLSASQIDRLLQSGKIRSLDAGQFLCKAGDNSNALWILLAGKLSILSGDFELTVIDRVDILGEMGLVTGLSRSASMKAIQDVVLLEILKLRLDSLLKKDIDLERKVYRNMMRSLCQKLRSTSTRLAEDMTKADREVMAALS